MEGDPEKTRFYIVNGELPGGIKFSEVNGTLSGTPAKESEVAISIVASHDHNLTVYLTIRAVQPKCEEETIEGYTFKETDLGRLANTECPFEMLGEVYRRCSYSSPPIWGVIDETQCRKKAK